MGKPQFGTNKRRHLERRRFSAEAKDLTAHELVDHQRVVPQHSSHSNCFNPGPQFGTNKRRHPERRRLSAEAKDLTAQDLVHHQLGVPQHSSHSNCFNKGRSLELTNGVILSAGAFQPKRRISQRTIWFT